MEQKDLPVVVILTALSIEYQAVSTYVGKLQEKVHSKGTVYEQGIFSTSEKAWNMVIAQISIGNPGAAFEVERAIQQFSPDVVLFVGVADGIKDVQLGDVVAADKVYSYESGKVLKSVFLPRPNVSESSYSLVERAKAEARKGDWLQRIKGHTQAATPSPRAVVGAIAAGEKVIASTHSTEWKLLQSTYSDALAVEMEGYGFLKAAHANSGIHTLVIRGISDLIDNKQEADTARFQEIAAQHASAFAFEVLAKFDIDKLSRNARSSSKNIPSKDELEEGRTYLKRGQVSLSNGNYTDARRYLKRATLYLPEDRTPQEAAQVKFLQAIAYLNGIRPFGITNQEWVRVEELMHSTIKLHPCSSYLYTLALFKRDCSRHGWKKTQYLREAEFLLNKANSTPSSTSDNENIALLWICQSDLMQDAH